MFIWFLMLFILWHLLPYFIFCAIYFGYSKNEDEEKNFENDNENSNVDDVWVLAPFCLIDITISFWCHFRLWLIFKMAGVKVIVDCKCLPANQPRILQAKCAMCHVCVFAWMCMCVCVYVDVFYFLCQFSIIFQSFLLQLLMPKEDYSLSLFLISKLQI